MKEELISFETAKLAKENGFDLVVHAFYDKNMCIDETMYHNWNEYKAAYSAPTQSLLQKWLREKYNKYVKVHPVYRDEKIQWEYVIFFLDEPLLSGTDGFKNRMSLLDYPYYWETFEEALENGLQEALKLIK